LQHNYLGTNGLYAGPHDHKHLDLDGVLNEVRLLVSNEALQIKRDFVSAETQRVLKNTIETQATTIKTLESDNKKMKDLVTGPQIHDAYTKICSALHWAQDFSGSTIDQLIRGAEFLAEEYVALRDQPAPTNGPGVPKPEPIAAKNVKLYINGVEVNLDFDGTFK